MSKSGNHFVLISFLPALAYWYLEENYPLRVALIGGLGLAILEISLEYFFTKHVHKISKLNFFLILGLGSISLLGEDGIWFKLQPFFTGLFMGGYLLFSLRRGTSLLLTMGEELGRPAPPKDIMMSFEKHMAIFLLLYGFFMAFIAFTQETKTWVFFKTGGFYIAFIIFALVEMFLMRRKILKMQKDELKREILKKM